MSARRLGVLMAEHRKLKPESARRTVQRWLAGTTAISDENAECLSEIFEKPDDYFKKPAPERRRPVWDVEAEAMREAIRDLEQRLQALEQPRPQLQEAAEGRGSE